MRIKSASAISRAYEFYRRNGWPSGCVAIRVPECIEIVNPFSDPPESFPAYSKPPVAEFTQVDILAYAANELDQARAMTQRIRDGMAMSISDQADYHELGELVKGQIEQGRGYKRELDTIYKRIKEARIVSDVDA